MNFQRKTLAIAVMVATSTLTACGSSDDKDPVVVDVFNNAPTALALSAATVDENAMGVEIGTLSATDADSGDTFTYTTDNANFVISGNTLSLAAETSFDYEAVTTVDVAVTVTDNGGLSHSETLTISVNDLLDYYGFASKFNDGESSISYTGQTARHVLINELKGYIGSGLQADIDANMFTTKDEVLAKLNSYYTTTDDQYDNFAITSFGDDAEQKFMANISSSTKNLKGKVAGQDTGGQHKDWSTEFVGWGAAGTISPDGLIVEFFDQLADNAVEVIGGAVRVDPITGEAISVYVNTNGTDLQQLVQKFLLMSITYSQSADDYFDFTTDGKGLHSSILNIEPKSDGANYSTLEHHFDEGFGYFGAARDYLSYNDNEIAGKVSSDDDGRSDWNGSHDTDDNGTIDLTAEINLGSSVNAAKRDRGTADNTNPTDYTKTAMDAFLMGRKLINDTAGESELTTEQRTTLEGYVTTAIDNWEFAIAATVVHYINDLRDDLEPLETGDAFVFADTAKHFSELKGFALGLQFNPYSDITPTEFQNLHTLIGDAPVLTDAAAVTAYRADLEAARYILESALGFDTENVTGW